MKDEWQPLVAACLIALCIAIGLGVGISPHSPWLPYEMAVRNQGRNYYKNGHKNDQNENSGNDMASPEKFEGQLRANPDNCYQGEHQGDCAARVVQEGISSFYLFLTIAAGASAVAAGLTGIAVFRQVKIARDQNRIMVQQAKIANVALPRPYLFFDVSHCNIRDWAFFEKGKSKEIIFTPRFRNFGNGPAIICFLYSRAYISGALPPKQGIPMEEFHHDNIIPIDEGRDFPIAPWIYVDSQKFRNITTEILGEIADDVKRVYLVGAVHYRDIFYRTYITAFCVSYDWGNARLRPEGEADYNYQT